MVRPSAGSLSQRPRVWSGVVRECYGGTCGEITESCWVGAYDLKVPPLFRDLHEFKIILESSKPGSPFRRCFAGGSPETYRIISIIVPRILGKQENDSGVTVDGYYNVDNETLHDDRREVIGFHHLPNC